MHRFANPTRFVRLADRMLPWLFIVTLGSFAVGLYMALITSPPDYQQGDSVRIMYVHAPSAWMGLFGYMVLAGASFASLVWRHPLADAAAKASAPIGAAFTGLALLTGSLWGQPMWGTWWVWDARLTSMLVLFFLYLGYMALWSAIEDRQKASKAAAILALVGAINVPIIKFSVDWWNTLHQPASIMRQGGPSMDSAMLWPLGIMFVAFNAYYAMVLMWRIKAELAARKIETLRYNQAARQEGPAARQEGPAARQEGQAVLEEGS
ncbi:MAG: heme ABC transporter permease [Proteobacteria bacterium]|nr:heme ABC transporter permease [Pseudomonadota bacterium]